MTARRAATGALRFGNGKVWLLGTTAAPPTGGGTPPPPAVSTADAVFFDIQPATAPAALNSPLAVTLTPRLGTWPATGTISLSSTLGGTFGAITVANGTATPATTTFTPTAAGYHLITATNTLGIKNPGYVGLAAFAASSGSALTISQTAAQLLTVKDFSIWERDCFGGAWASGWTQGWGRFDVPITLSGAASALWMRLYDGMSAGATTTAGTGTLLQAEVQVRGAIASGASTVSLNLPAGMNYYYVELATDQAFTNPYRIPKRFGVGHRIGMSTRSYLCVMTWGWKYFGFTTLPNYLTMAGGYGLAASYVISGGQLAVSDWKLHDGVPGNDTSPGVMELCRLMSSALGVLTGMIGFAPAGGSLDQHMTTQGQLNTLGANAGSIATATNGLTKFRYFLMGERDTTLSDPQWQREVGLITDWLATQAGCPVLMCPVPLDNYHTGAWQTSLIGSALDAGSGRMLNGVIALEQTRRDVVHAAPMTGKYVNEHSGMIDRVLLGRDIARAFLYRTDPALGGTGGPNGIPRAPRFATTGGTRAPGSYVIEIPIEHRGGNSIVGVKVDWSADAAPVTVQTPSAIELATLFTVRLRGEYNDYGRRAAAKAITWESQYGVCVAMDRTNPVQIINTAPGVSKLRITLDSTVPGSIKFVDGSTMTLSDAQAFSISYGMDIPVGVINPSTTVYTQIPGYGNFINGSYWLTDDQNPENIQWGRAMQREMLYYIEAPAPVAQSISVATPTCSFLPGGWMELSGPPGTGRRLPGLQFAIDGGQAVDPAWQKCNDDNSWQAALIAPAAGAHTVSVFRKGSGTADATTAFNVSSMAAMLGAGSDAGYMNLSTSAQSGYLESYSACNRAAQWSDIAGTIHPAGELSTIARWDGDSGNIANRLGLFTSGGIDYTYPSIDFQAIGTCLRDATSSVTAFDKYTQRAGVSFEVRSALKGNCTPIVSQMTGDFTVVAAHRTMLGSSAASPWAVVDGAGTTQLIAVTDNSGLPGIFKRGNNTIPSAPAISTNGGSTLVCYVLTYQVATGTLKLFMAKQDGSSWSSLSNTVAPNTITPAALLVYPYFGAIFFLGYWSMPFGGDLASGDVNAALTHLVNRWS